MVVARLWISLAVVASATALSAQSTSANSRAYGAQFLWGTAISAHQVEGLTGGGQNADWYPFEHTPGRIRNGDTADVATDHWQRYDTDLKLASAMATNTLRTSVAWEKIEPAPGVYSTEVINHYRAELTEMRQLGLRPMITLLHGTVPLWFQNRGGWLAPDSPQQFAAYAQFVVQKLGDLCDLWVTINEPMVLLGEGYLEGITPPQIPSPLLIIPASWNMVRAHRLATARIHQIQPVPPNQPSGPLRGVGLVNGLEIYDPYSFDLADVVVNAIVAEIANWAFPNAAVYGSFEIGELLAQVQGTRSQPISGSLDAAGESGSPIIDWFGVNYYTRTLVQFNPNGIPHMIVPPGPTGDNGTAIYPEGLERILRETATRFPKLPIVVTENGVADARDQYRPQFIRDSLRYLDRAKFGHEGLPPIDVRGYYHWSLTDNFEWQLGYGIRYGLVAILYDQNLQRVPRGSASVYRQQILSRK